MESNLRDNLLFINPKNSKEYIIFNFHTWCKMLEAIIVQYGKKDLETAKKLIYSSDLYEHALDDYVSVSVMAEELTYHWAMMLAFGHMYWLNGIDSIIPNGFVEWDKQYRIDHNLAEDDFEFEP